ncbi:MAG: sigma-70 family RNA polymerase sigma factor [Kofleriaceae bacterium]
MADRDDQELLARIRQGDEGAFSTIVDRHHAALRRFARTFVSSDASAEEVVQDTWMAMLDGLENFEGRSSLKTWLFRILLHRATTKGVREARSIPMAPLRDDEDGVPSAASARFDGRGRWAEPPRRWDVNTPQTDLLRRELGEQLELALRDLPPRQRTIVMLRDALGWSAQEVCNVLDVSETNQRVILHRARTRLRDALERYSREG